MIKEVIVVEGKDDISAVKAAVDAEIISTHGFGYGKKLISLLQDIEKRRGIIIFTDPDYMGNKIRKDLAKNLENPKHAFLPQGKAMKKDNIGVENASAEDIIEALKGARPNYEDKIERFTQKDLRLNGLVNSDGANEKRNKVSDILKIGHGNGKQFLNKLNSFNISIEEFENAVKAVEDGKII